MSIELGLGRVQKLLRHLKDPQKALRCVHVAGTNGKGSTLAYVSSILAEANIRHGRFTSPHMMLVNDCVTINRNALPMERFQDFKNTVERENNSLQLGCTEFEILTCAAFLAFAIEKVEIALIEVGLGGRLDATNVINEESMLVSAITKIGIDHEAFLGTTISQIAKEKAGIIKRGIDCVVDLTNSIEALEVVRAKAKQEGSLLHEVDGRSDLVQKLIQLSPLKGKYQAQNLAVALEIIRILESKHAYKIPNEAIQRGIQKTVWPGRLQAITDPETGIEVLIDGAHNESAAIELALFLKEHRKEGKGMIFVIALTKGKSVENLLKHIIESDLDTVVPTVFSQPEGMPWIQSYSAEIIREEAKKFGCKVEEKDLKNTKDLFSHLSKMRKYGDGRQIVVCGSLYLCGDILRGINYATAK